MGSRCSRYNDGGGHRLAWSPRGHGPPVPVPVPVLALTAALTILLSTSATVAMDPGDPGGASESALRGSTSTLPGTERKLAHWQDSGQEGRALQVQAPMVAEVPPRVPHRDRGDGNGLGSPGPTSTTGEWGGAQ
jgi:hypothetical protein